MKGNCTVRLVRAGKTHLMGRNRSKIIQSILKEVKSFIDLSIIASYHTKIVLGMFYAHIQLSNFILDPEGAFTSQAMYHSG